MTKEEAIRIIKIVLAVAEDFEIIVQGEEFTEEKCKEAVDMAIKALEQEPCEDAVSREDALQALCKAVHKNDDTIPCLNQRVSCLWDKTKVQDYAEGILKLPPVKPEQKMGRWIKSEIPNEEYVCSECGGACWYYDVEKGVAKSRFCPNCGAKMEEVKK